METELLSRSLAASFYETCIVCVKKDKPNKILGCVNWGFKVTRKGKKYKFTKYPVTCGLSGGSSELQNNLSVDFPNFNFGLSKDK